ncbi:hypothetical protein [Methylorubrum zatmanii]|uniref:Uncharacterized protein n=1 Tax=Methylorubrum zatmanii TaxID=29429 RepID=A0ABW1WUM0_9HYPH|nr:hypothetical protein [Methylorubrum zatmanii]MBD8909522.1 hypothetical protein [Methylorubrum zatmanii]
MKHPSLARLLGIGLAPVLLVGAAAAQEAPAAPGKPANLCQELLAFVKQPEPAKQAAATPPQQATAVSNPSGKSGSGSPSSSGGEPQQKSSLSGPVPSGETAPKAQKNVLAQANAEAKVPPAPGTPGAGPRPDAALVGKVETAAAADDQTACRAAAREMRTAGVAMPPPLLALAALDPRFFGK